MSLSPIILISTIYQVSKMFEGPNTKDPLPGLLYTHFHKHTYPLSLSSLVTLYFSSTSYPHKGCLCEFCFYTIYLVDPILHVDTKFVVQKTLSNATFVFSKWETRIFFFLFRKRTKSETSREYILLLFNAYD